MTRALAALLLLTGCAPSVDVRVTDPATISAIACGWGKPDLARCKNVVGLTFHGPRPVIYVPKWSAETAWIWDHEFRHANEGPDPHEYQTIMAKE